MGMNVCRDGCRGQICVSMHGVQLSTCMETFYPVNMAFDHLNPKKIPDQGVPTLSHELVGKTLLHTYR